MTIAVWILFTVGVLLIDRYLCGPIAGWAASVEPVTPQCVRCGCGIGALNWGFCEGCWRMIR